MNFIIKLLLLFITLVDKLYINEDNAAPGVCKIYLIPFSNSSIILLMLTNIKQYK